MPTNKKKQTAVLSEMTDIIARHLSKLPSEERKTKIEAFEKTINRGVKRASARPKAASTSRTPRKTRRAQA